MGFLAPAFLAAFAAVAVPIVIHLVNRERREVVAFPSLMFLQRINYRAVRRQKLRHLLLLAMRCLALAIIVAAFARPFLARRTAVAPAGGGRAIVVLLDRSYSMGYGDHWRRAADAAVASARGLAVADRVALVLFDDDAELAVPPTGDAHRIAAAVAAARPGDGRTRYAPALRLAQKLLAGSNLPRRELVLVSDFQQRGWERPEEIGLGPDTRIATVDVSGDSGDVAVASVSTTRDSSAQRHVVTVAARLTNTARAPAARTATLAINGRDVQTKGVTVPASGAMQVTFAPTVVPNGVSRGVVRTTPDRLTADDRAVFTISPQAESSVLLLEPANPRPDQALFVTRALSLGDAPSFTVTTKNIAGVVPGDLAGRALVIADETGLPGGTVGARLRDYVRAGGGLLVVPGSVAASAIAPEWRSLLPGGLGDVMDRAASNGVSLGTVDLTNPVFEVFAAPHAGDFSTARFLRYRALRIRGDSGVLARYDDGGVALAVRPVGTGHIAVWTSSLDTWWNDLPLQPVFLPFMHQLARNVGRISDTRPSYTVGDVLDLSRHAELTDGIAAAPGGHTVYDVALPDGQRQRTDSTRPLVALRESGFYEIRAPGASPGTGRIVAVNVDPAEADLAHLDPKALVAALRAPATPTGSRTPAPRSADEQERSQTLWWYLLLGAMMLLAAETVISNRLSNSAA